MDANAWNKQKGSDKNKKILRKAKLSIKLASLEWDNFSPTMQKRITKAAQEPSKGKGWHEAAQPTATPEGIKNVAPKHRKAAIKESMKDVERVAMVLPEKKHDKDPWEMTREEWNSEFERLRPNAQGTGGNYIGTNIGKSKKGAEIKFAYIQDKINKLKLGLKDIPLVEGSPEIGARPARHYDVVKAAYLGGKPIPPYVLDEYPDIKAIKNKAAIQANEHHTAGKTGTQDTITGKTDPPTNRERIKQKN